MSTRCQYSAAELERVGDAARVVPRLRRAIASQPSSVMPADHVQRVQAGHHVVEREEQLRAVAGSSRERVVACPEQIPSRKCWLYSTPLSTRNSEPSSDA